MSFESGKNNMNIEKKSMWETMKLKIEWRKSLKRIQEKLVKILEGNLIVVHGYQGKNFKVKGGLLVLCTLEN